MQAFFHAQTCFFPNAEAVPDLSSGKDENVIARVDPRTTTRAGDDVKVALDTSRLHFFDKDTEETILNR